MPRTHDDVRPSSRLAVNNDHVWNDEEYEVDDNDATTRPEASLLNGHCVKSHSELESRDYTLTQRGRLRAYWLGIVVCIGGFLRKSLANA